MLRYPILALCAAALTGCGFDISASDNKDRRLPLEKAAQAGDSAEVNRLLAAGADPNGHGGIFGGPLYAAAVSRSNNGAVIRALVAAGAHVEGRAPEPKACWTPPLLLAASLDLTENVEALLDLGASLPNSSQKAPCTTLIVGHLRGRVLELLTHHGLNLNKVDENGRNELHLALAPPVMPNADGIEYLIKAGVPLNARDRSGKTPLAYWKEPRGYERRSAASWVFEFLDSDSNYQRYERDNRTKISALLERSGALL